MTFISEVTRNIPLNDIVVVDNTRSQFDETALKELAQSIRVNGVLQSILVKPMGDNSYRLVCGERRWRASFLANKSDIPARIMDIDDSEILCFQIIENLQRQNISLMDEVRAVVRLRDEQSMSVSEMVKKLGKSSQTIDAFFQIAKTTPELHEAIENKQVNRSVALVIAGIESQEHQVEAVAALKRDNKAQAVSKKEAEIYVSRTFGAQSKRLHRKKAKTSTGRFASDWKYYMVRFSAAQFDRWKMIVNLRTETEIFAQAVEQVMAEARQDSYAERTAIQHHSV